MAFEHRASFGDKRSSARILSVPFRVEAMNSAQLFDVTFDLKLYCVWCPFAVVERDGSVCRSRDYVRVVDYEGAEFSNGYSEAKEVGKQCH